MLVVDLVDNCAFQFLIFLILNFCFKTTTWPGKMSTSVTSHPSIIVILLLFQNVLECKYNGYLCNGR